MNDIPVRTDSFLQKELFKLNSPDIKQDLQFSLLYTFFWGLLAHAYGFLHDAFSHDSLNALYAGAIEETWKIQIGRVFVPAYRAITRGPIALPWLIGLLSLLWISFAVFIIVRLFHVNNKATILLIAGVFATNITVIAGAATYIYELDINMFALFLSTLAVYLWRQYRWGFLPGALFITITLGLYQAYFSVSVVLILFVFMMDLLNAVSFKLVLQRIIKVIGMVFGGAALYLVALSLFNKLTGASMNTGTYNSVASVSSLFQSSALDYFVPTYLYWIKSYFSLSVSRYPSYFAFAIHVMLAAIVSLFLLSILLEKKMHTARKVFLLVLGVFIPLGMDLFYIVSRGMVHTLMTFSFWLVYLLVLLFVNWRVDHGISQKWPALWKYIRGCAFFLIAIIILSNVQIANTIYLKKDLEQSATLSLMTRVVYRMEETNGYVPGETPVVFIGVSDQINSSMPGFDSYNKIMGAGLSQAITQSTSTYYFNIYEAYFKYVLKNPAIMADDKVWTSYQTDREAIEMPCFPASGCTKIEDGVLLVKMSN